MCVMWCTRRADDEQFRAAMTVLGDETLRGAGQPVIQLLVHHVKDSRAEMHLKAKSTHIL